LLLFASLTQSVENQQIYAEIAVKFLTNTIDDSSGENVDNDSEEVPAQHNSQFCLLSEGVLSSVAVANCHLQERELDSESLVAYLQALMIHFNTIQRHNNPENRHNCYLASILQIIMLIYTQTASLLREVEELNLFLAKLCSKSASLIQQYCSSSVISNFLAVFPIEIPNLARGNANDGQLSHPTQQFLQYFANVAPPDSWLHENLVCRYNPFVGIANLSDSQQLFAALLLDCTSISNASETAAKAPNQFQSMPNSTDHAHSTKPADFIINSPGKERRLGILPRKKGKARSRKRKPCNGGEEQERAASMEPQPLNFAALDAIAPRRKKNKLNLAENSNSSNNYETTSESLDTGNHSALNLAAPRASVRSSRSLFFNSSQSAPFTRQPHQILLLISSFLPSALSFVRFSSVCRYFHGEFQLKEYNSVWLELVYAEFSEFAQDLQCCHIDSQLHKGKLDELLPEKQEFDANQQEIKRKWLKTLTNRQLSVRELLSNHDWQRYYKKIHNLYKEFSFICGICGCWRGFRTQEKFSQHIQQHKLNAQLFRDRAVQENLEIYDINQYKRQKLLLEEESNSSSEAKLFTCSFLDCSQRFSQKSKLSRHFSTHGAAKKFSCSFLDCERSYNSQWELRQHYHKHTGTARKHRCGWPGCEKSFDRPGQQMKHYQSHKHNGEKAWSCSSQGCSQSYLSAAALKNHVAHEHERDKLHFSCKMYFQSINQVEKSCDQAFYHKSQLKRHLADHHKVITPASTTFLY
jgi:hypothetical protein